MTNAIINDNIDLAIFDNEYEHVEVQEFDNQKLPDGKYSMLIVEVEIKPNKNNTPMIVYQLQPISGEYSSRFAWKNQTITQDALPFIKKDLSVLGIELDKFSDIKIKLNNAVNLCVEVTAKTKGEFQSFYFNSLIKGKKATATKGNVKAKSQQQDQEQPIDFDDDVIPF